MFSAAEEAELLINGISLSRKKAGEALIYDMPMTFLFEAVYQPGTVEAESYTDGKEISRSLLKSTGMPVSIRLTAETDSLKADGASLCYVHAELIDAEGNVVPDADTLMTAQATGAAELLGFGSGNPITEENYIKGRFISFQGRVLAVLRAGYEAGEVRLKVSADGIGSAERTLPVQAV